MSGVGLTPEQAKELYNIDVVWLERKLGKIVNVWEERDWLTNDKDDFRSHPVGLSIYFREKEEDDEWAHERQTT